MSKNVKSKLAKVPAKRKGKYQMPDPIPGGVILTDLTKKQWKVGPSIGKGGFGEIYSATEVSTGKNAFVVKIEPKENGPLFVEMHFFMKVCKGEDIEKWKISRKLKFLGLPQFVGNGSYVHKDKPYRFVVMEKLGSNLESKLKENNGVLPSDFIFKIALQIIDALEYIHSKGYVHADIKAGNLLMGLKKGTEDKVYLVDFGLASKYSTDFKPDPKCAHNGTIEFTSRDAHVGATTRRGDLEILAFNMLRWFTSRLPWEDKLSNCSYVQQQKLDYMKNIPGLMNKCFGSHTIPESLSKYFQYVAQMTPTVEPDYDLCRNIFQDGLKASAVRSRTTPKKQLPNSKKEQQNIRSSEEEVNGEAPSRLERKRKSPYKGRSEKELKVVNSVDNIENGEANNPENISTVKVNDQNKKKGAETVSIDSVASNSRKHVTKTVKKEESLPQTVMRSANSPSTRPVRNVKKPVNGYMDETISFGESEDSDVVYSPPRTPRKKGLKRMSDDTYSPSRKFRSKK